MRPFLLAGEPKTGSAAQAVRNPYTGAVVDEVAMASWADVDRALRAAVSAFAWTRTEPAAGRARRLADAARAIRGRAGELTDLIVAEGGKGSGYGREGLRYAMEEMSETRILVLSNLDL